MAMLFHDLPEDILLAVLARTPLISRLHRLTLVSRRFHRLVDESLRRTSSLAIVFPRNGQKTRNKNKNNHFPDRRMAYFRRNYPRTEVLPESHRIYIAPDQRPFPAKHLLSLFPRLTSLQLVHPRLGDSKGQLGQLNSLLRRLSSSSALCKLSVFFLCTSSVATQKTALGRLSGLLQSCFSDNSNQLRSLTVTVDLTHQLRSSLSQEDEVESGKAISYLPKLDLSQLQELTVLFGGKYTFADDFLTAMLQCCLSPQLPAKLQCLTFNGIVNREKLGDHWKGLLTPVLANSPQLRRLSMPDLFDSLPLPAAANSPNSSQLQELHLQLALTSSLDALLVPATAFSSLRHLHLDFSCFGCSIFLITPTGSPNSSSSSLLSGLQKLTLQGSALLHGGTVSQLASQDNQEKAEDEADEEDSQSIPSLHETAIKRVAAHTPNLSCLVLANNFEFSKRFAASGDMRSGARWSAAQAPPKLDCPRCRNKLLYWKVDDNGGDGKKWPSTDAFCLERFRRSVKLSAWANCLKVVAVQREDNWSMQNSSEMVFDEMYL